LKKRASYFICKFCLGKRTDTYPQYEKETSICQIEKRGKLFFAVKILQNFNIEWEKGLDKETFFGKGNSFFSFSKEKEPSIEIFPCSIVYFFAYGPCSLWFLCGNRPL